MFDAGVLTALRHDPEVRIGTRAQTKAVPIWVVVVGSEVFVRSVRGPKGKWYVAAAADGAATLEVGGRQIAVTVTPVTDASMIAAVSQAFLGKYAGSPYAQSIVAPDTLATTLRLANRKQE